MMKCKMCPVHMVAAILVLVGALNWGLVGAFNYNLVNMLFGGVPTLERVIYVLVGLAAIAMLFVCKCKQCKEGCCKDGNCKEDKGSCCGSDSKPM